MGEPEARVLVIDDELFFREAISDILSAEGFAVTEASDGESGVAAATEPGVAVAIVDIRLPGIDGVEVLRRIRAGAPAVRVIMLSAHTDQELVLEALRLGACDYLAKPLHDEELVLATRRAAESFALSDDWGRLRGRLDRLVTQLDDLARHTEASPADRRRGIVSEAASRIASDVLEAERVSLLLVDDSGQELHVVSAVGHRLAVGEFDPVPLGEGVVGFVCERSEPLLVRDIAEDARFRDASPPDRYRSRSFVVAPLSLGEQPLGALCAAERAGGGEFVGEDLALMRLLAVHLSGILGRARPVADGAEDADDLQRSPDAETAPLSHEPVAAADVAELSRLVCDAIGNEVEPERMFQALLRALAEALPAAPVSIFLPADDASGLRCEATHDGGLRADRSELAADRGLTGCVLRSGQMVASDTPDADGRFDPEIDTPLDGVVSPLLCVPLVLRGKVVGVFRAFPRDGAPASARAGEILGAAVSAAVRNALLYRSLLESIDEVAEARRAARQ
jgi:DNA-binding response OmpR family regulator